MAANKEMEPPLIPQIVRNKNQIISAKIIKFFFIFITQKHRKDLCNFEAEFTKEKTDLTPTDKLFMMNLDQNDFIGFSYMNPEFITIV